jgi:hypothetical protein
MFLQKVTLKRGGGGTRLYSQHLGGRGRQISEFKASLVYKLSSRTPRATQRNPVSKKTTKKKKTKKQKNKKKKKKERNKKSYFKYFYKIIMESINF